jgi:hypothetical protein
MPNPLYVTVFISLQSGHISRILKERTLVNSIVELQPSETSLYKAIRDYKSTLTWVVWLLFP